MGIDVKIIKQKEPNSWKLGTWTYNYNYKHCAENPLNDGADAFFVTFDKEALEDIGFAVSYDWKSDQEFIDSLGSQILNYSYDGAIYWIPKEVANRFLSELEVWFVKPENQHIYIDSGLSNCLIIRETPNGLCILDATMDFGSTFDGFFASFVSSLADELREQTLVVEDSHLIDHLYLGRGCVTNEKDVFLKLYQEKVLNELFFFNDSLDKDSMDLEAFVEDLGTNKVVLLGNFQSIEKSCNVVEFLAELGLTVVPEMSEDTIVLVGGFNHTVLDGFREIENLGLEVYSLDKFIETAINYFEE